MRQPEKKKRSKRRQAQAGEPSATPLTAAKKSKQLLDLNCFQLAVYTLRQLSENPPAAHPTRRLIPVFLHPSIKLMNTESPVDSG